MLTFLDAYYLKSEGAEGERKYRGEEGGEMKNGNTSEGPSAVMQPPSYEKELTFKTVPRKLKEVLESLQELGGAAVSGKDTIGVSSRRLRRLTSKGIQWNWAKWVRPGWEGGEISSWRHRDRGGE